MRGGKAANPKFMFPKIAQLKTVGALRARLTELGLQLPVDDEVLSAASGSPLGALDRDWRPHGR